MSIRGLTVADRPPADIGRIRRSNESCIPPDPVSENPWGAGCAGSKGSPSLAGRRGAASRSGTHAWGHSKVVSDDAGVSRGEASLAGFEPATRCLEGSCSIHLSYRDTHSASFSL